MRFHFLVMLLTVTIMAGTSWAETVVLFDQAHGERFLSGDQAPLGLAGLTDTLKNKGLTLRPLMERASENTLSGSAGIIISGPFSQFTQAEIDALAHYVENGGTIAIMLHIAPPAVNLLHRLGVAVTNGVLRENKNIIKDEPLNFSVHTDTSHPLMTGIASFNLYGAWGLLATSPTAAAIASTSETSWIDRDGDKKQTERDATQSFAVAVAGTLGKGKFVVFGDDAIFQNQFLSDGNRALAGNLALWLSR